MPALHDLTIAQARRALTAAFAARGIDSAEADARLLLGAALGLDYAALVARGDAVMRPEQAAAAEAFAARRLAHEPVARILGHKEFWSLPLKVTHAVLVPRPETETVIELALDYVVAGGLRDERLRVLDIGTGSGALLIALLSELPRATGIGTDISLEALDVARTNAAATGLESRTLFAAGHYGEAAAGPFDIVVSNPPYIAQGDIANLAPDVRDYDPHLALDGGKDGLDAYRAITGDAKRLLKPGGRLIMELGAGQARSVTALIEAAGLRERALRNDLAGIPRVIAAGFP